MRTKVKVASGTICLYSLVAWKVNQLPKKIKMPRQTNKHLKPNHPEVLHSVQCQFLEMERINMSRVGSCPLADWEFGSTDAPSWSLILEIQLYCFLVCIDLVTTSLLEQRLLHFLLFPGFHLRQIDLVLKQ